MAFKLIAKFIPGARETQVIDYTFPVSYPTGGVVLTKAALGIIRGRVRHIRVGMVSTAGVASPTKLCVWDHINSKILLYTAAGAEAANASNQSTVTVRLEVEVR